LPVRLPGDGLRRLLGSLRRGLLVCRLLRSRRVLARPRTGRNRRDVAFGLPDVVRGRTLAAVALRPDLVPGRGTGHTLAGLRRAILAALERVGLAFAALRRARTGPRLGTRGLRVLLLA